MIKTGGVSHVGLPELETGIPGPDSIETDMLQDGCITFPKRSFSGSTKIEMQTALIPPPDPILPAVKPIGFQTTVLDTLSEFSGSIFTPQETGYYYVNFLLRQNMLNLNDYVAIFLNFGSEVQRFISNFTYGSPGNYAMELRINQIVPVEFGQTFQMTIGFSAAKISPPNPQNLKIFRVA